MRKLGYTVLFWVIRPPAPDCSGEYGLEIRLSEGIAPEQNRFARHEELREVQPRRVFAPFAEAAGRLRERSALGLSSRLVSANVDQSECFKNLFLL
jgi:hypothetical protein